MNGDEDYSGNAATAMGLFRLRGVGAKSVGAVLRRMPPSAGQTDVTDLLHKTMGDTWWAQNLDQTSQLGTWVSMAWQDLERYANSGVRTLALGDRDYPALLALAADAPPVIYVRGSLGAMRDLSLAVVGTRAPADRSRQIARRLAAEFGRRGYAIVSGLAHGIDAEGHEGALDACAPTVAVLGTAIDKIYPADNKDLAHRILGAEGALISEIPPGGAGGRHAFVQRDRIQAALALGVVAVQTSASGGTMHTVRFAEDYRRRVLCPRMPSESTTDDSFSGNLELSRGLRCREFDRQDYDAVDEELRLRRGDLLAKDELF